jgi:hypothetical protein
VYLPHAWSLTLLLFVGDPAVADATTLETVPVIRRRYVTPRAYTLPELIRIREVYIATLQSGRPVARIAAELAIELGRTHCSVRKRLFRLRREAERDPKRYPAQLHSTTPQAPPTALAPPTGAIAAGLELTFTSAAIGGADAALEDSITRETTGTPAASFQHKISED